MEHSKIINTINRFDGIISKIDYLDKEERFFVENFELEFSKSVIHDFGEISARKLALILLSAMI